jgi:RNA polymerase sigma-70 factor, ECF subfamily
MPEHQEPDAELMLRVKRGDGEALATLVERYKQPVLNLVGRMLRDPAESEDVAQTVFLQVYRSAHRYQTNAKFTTWLFTIARNLCLNELRRRSRHPAESIDAQHPEHADEPLRQFEDVKTSTPPENALHNELEAKISQAIADLPENQRLALLLCRQDELSYEEMAKVLGCTVSATKSLIHRGRETIKARLKPYLHSGIWEKEK